MWLVQIREPPADAPYWPGRRWLASLDALGWPVLWVLLVQQISQSVGLLGPVVCATALLCALGRLRCAVYVNHRYRFTTCRWGRFAFALLLLGALLKLMLLTRG